MCFCVFVYVHTHERHVHVLVCSHVEVRAKMLGAFHLTTLEQSLPPTKKFTILGSLGIVLSLLSMRQLQVYIAMVGFLHGFQETEFRSRFNGKRETR